jgi:hypothetical protein
VRGRRLPFAISIVFTLLGLVLLILGTTDARLAGLMIVLFFGVGSLGLMTPLATRRDTDSARLVNVGGERGLLLPIARRKQAMTVLAACGMGSACGLLAGMTGALWIAIAGGGLFGAVALYGLSLVPRERGLALTPTRVKLLGWGDPELDWDAIGQVVLYRQGYNRMLGVIAIDRTLVRRRRRSLTARLTRFDLALPAELLAGTPEHAWHTVTAYMDDPERRARLGTQDEVTYLRLADGDGLR